MAFNFKKFWLDMSKEEREAFARDAGTTSHYITTHLTRRGRTPSRKLMERLFSACEARNAVTEKSDFLNFFYS